MPEGPAKLKKRVEMLKGAVFEDREFTDLKVP